MRLKHVPVILIGALSIVATDLVTSTSAEAVTIGNVLAKARAPAAHADSLAFLSVGRASARGTAEQRDRVFKDKSEDDWHYHQGPYHKKGSDHYLNKKRHQKTSGDRNSGRNTSRDDRYGPSRPR